MKTLADGTFTFSVRVSGLLGRELVDLERGGCGMRSERTIKTNRGERKIQLNLFYMEGGGGLLFGGYFVRGVFCPGGLLSRPSGGYCILSGGILS